MTDIHYFVVAASMDDNGEITFVVDDEVFMARFPDGGVWSEDTQTWDSSGEGIDTVLAEALAEQLGK